MMYFAWRVVQVKCCCLDCLLSPDFCALALLVCSAQGSSRSHRPLTSAPLAANGCWTSGGCFISFCLKHAASLCVILMAARPRLLNLPVCLLADMFGVFISILLRDHAFLWCSHDLSTLLPNSFHACLLECAVFIVEMVFHSMTFCRGPGSLVFTYSSLYSLFLLFSIRSSGKYRWCLRCIDIFTWP